jgi:hypothetical protein
MEPMVYTSSEIPGRLIKIINLLEGYRKDIVQRNTLRGQDPLPIQAMTRAILREKGQMLTNWMKMREITEEMKEDKEFMNVIEELQNLLEPWDANVSVMAPDYVESLFFTCPFTSYEHCERLRKSAKDSFTPPAIPYRNTD